MKCFDNTARHFMNCGHFANAKLVVCHGIIEARKTGEEGTTGHAWVEHQKPGKPKERIAVDPSIPTFMDRDEYREQLKPRNVVEYSPQEFLYNWWLHGFPGPWDTEIKKWVKP